MQKGIKHQLRNVINAIKKFGKIATRSKHPTIPKEQLIEKFKGAAKKFGKAATTSKHPIIPKEQQISIDLGNKKFPTVGNKILYWLQDTFKNFFPRFGFFAEFGEKRKIIGTDIEVKHFTPEEQDEHTAYTYIDEKDGELRLYDFNGNIYDTTDKVSKGKKGSVAYAITLDGKLVIHEHLDVGRCEEYAYRHSTLGGGKAILCSGLMKIKNGKITHIDNNSGHYKPTSANLYNAVKKLEGVFSQDAKVACLSYWERLKKEISLTRKIPAKKESIEKFLERMEKVGKDGLTEYERHFKKVKKYNEEYTHKLKSKSVYNKVVASHYEPVPILDNNDPRVIKMTIEHSIRRIIGADYGNKPEVNVKYDKKEVCGVDIAFKQEDDRSRLMDVLDTQQCSYISRTHENKYKITVSTEQAHEFIKNTLQIKIDSIEQLDITDKSYHRNS